MAESALSDCFRVGKVEKIGIMASPVSASKKKSRDGNSEKSAADGPDPSKPLSKNEHLINWVDKMADLTKPAAIHWVTGSDSENEALCESVGSWAARSSSSIRSFGPVATMRSPIQATSRASKTGPSSALSRKTMPARQTTGSIPSRCAAS